LRFSKGGEHSTDFDVVEASLSKLGLVDPFQFAMFLSRIERNPEVFKESVHPKQASSREFLGKCRSNDYRPARYVERDIVEIGTRLASDSGSFFNFPFFYIKPDVSPNARMKHAARRPRVNDRFKALCPWSILGWQGKAYA